jgi:methyltransferase (TIGR00027 family)
MEESRASLTAMAASLIRAIHTRVDEHPLIDDPWGDRLVTEADKQEMRTVAASRIGAPDRARLEALGPGVDIIEAGLRASPVFGMVVVRTRYAEDALEAAVARGVRQYVIVGAGLDSFAMRRPPWARDVDVFEVDHPATQAMKRRRLADYGVVLSDKHHFVSADLSREGLASALKRTPFQPTTPSFFSWLGVTTYLTREANLSTLRAMATCGAAGSEVVFTYRDQRDFDADPTDGALHGTGATVAAMGEPWVSGFHPDELAGDLRGVGLTLVENLNGEELNRRYFARRTDGLSAPRSLYIARAQVAR